VNVNELNDTKTHLHVAQMSQEGTLSTAGRVSWPELLQSSEFQVQQPGQTPNIGISLRNFCMLLPGVHYFVYTEYCGDHRKYVW